MCLCPCVCSLVWRLEDWQCVLENCFFTASWFFFLLASSTCWQRFSLFYASSSSWFFSFSSYYLSLCLSSSVIFSSCSHLFCFQVFFISKLPVSLPFSLLHCFTIVKDLSKNLSAKTSKLDGSCVLAVSDLWWPLSLSVFLSLSVSLSHSHSLYVCWFQKVLQLESDEHIFKFIKSKCGLGPTRYDFLYIHICTISDELQNTHKIDLQMNLNVTFSELLTSTFSATQGFSYCTYCVHVLMQQGVNGQTWARTVNDSPVLWFSDSLHSNAAHISTVASVLDIFCCCGISPSCLRWCNSPCMIFSSKMLFAWFNPLVLSIFYVFHLFSPDQHP